MTSILQHFRNVRKLLKIQVRLKIEQNAFHLAINATDQRIPFNTAQVRTTTASVIATGKIRRDFCTLKTSMVQVEKDENITLIGIYREKYRNSINLEVSQALNDAISQFELDSNSPVAVLYGVGGSFSAGHDVIELEQQFEMNNLNYLLNTEGSIPTGRHLKKPIVCAINGFCVAGGLELALLCDLRVMEDTAVIGFFNRKFGVPICHGGTVRLSKLIGYSRALDMISTGRPMKAKEAFEIGLVNRIVATGTSLGQAVNLAFSIAKYPQNSLLHDRTSIYTNVFEGKTFDENVQKQIMLTDEIITEFRTGVHKFVKSEIKGAKIDAFGIKEKHLPDWEKDEIRKENEYRKGKLK